MDEEDDVSTNIEYENSRLKEQLSKVLRENEHLVKQYKEREGIKDNDISTIIYKYKEQFLENSLDENMDKYLNCFIENLQNKKIDSDTLEDLEKRKALPKDLMRYVAKAGKNFYERYKKPIEEAGGIDNLIEFWELNKQNNFGDRNETTKLKTTGQPKSAYNENDTSFADTFKRAMEKKLRGVK